MNLAFGGNEMAKLNYKATIDLLPAVWGETTETEMRDRIGNWVSIKRGTIAYSIHDAVGLVSNAREDSVIRIWNANFLNEADLTWIMDAWENVEFFNLPGFIPKVWNVTDQLPSNGAYPKRGLDEVYFQTIHHTVGWDYNASNLQNAINIAYGHINGRGWPGIAYHYLIGPNGSILQTNYLTSSSFHAGSREAPGDENRTAIGVCMGGDFRWGEPTMAQQSSAASIVDFNRRSFHNHLAVVPHKRMAGAATVCPGTYNVNDFLKRIDGYTDWI